MEDFIKNQIRRNTTATGSRNYSDEVNSSEYKAEEIINDIFKLSIREATRQGKYESYYGSVSEDTKVRELVTDALGALGYRTEYYKTDNGITQLKISW